MQVDDYFSPADVKGCLSLDRVTFLLLSPSLSLWSMDLDKEEYERTLRRIENLKSMIATQLSDVLDPDFSQGSGTDLFCCHFRTSDGVDIQFGTKKPKRRKITDEGLLEAFGTLEEKKQGYKYEYMPNAYALRIEYNPNKSDLSSVSKLLGGLSRHQTPNEIRIARLDIAIDYKSSLVPEMVLCDGMRKTFTASGSKGLESIYFGTRKSRNYFRLYDKRQEQIDSAGVDIGYDLWRLELESKESFFFDSCPDHGKVFQRFRFYDGAAGSGDWLLDLIRSQAMQYGLQNVLRRMPPNTATRYRKIFKAESFRQKVEEPGFVYYRDFPGAMERLRVQILTACGFKVQY